MLELRDQNIPFRTHRSGPPWGSTFPFASKWERQWCGREEVVYDVDRCRDPLTHSTLFS